MNGNEFLTELEKRLKYLPKEDREDAIAYYKEYISDMDSEAAADVTKTLGAPKEVAKEILGTATEKAIETQSESKSVKGSGKIVWLVILGVASLPVSLPLAIAAVALVVAFLAVVFAVLLSFAAASIAIFFGGIISLVGIIAVPGFASKLVCFGTALVLLGLGAFALIGTYALFKLIIKLIGKLFTRRKSNE